MSSIWNTLQGVEFKQTYIDAGGIRTRSITAGDGPVLIFLHGTGGHAEAYLRNIEAHARHFTVHAIDMVGHGYTDMPDIDYSPQHYVDHLLAFVDAIGADKVHISGESLGAQVAAWFALQHPGRVNKIVMNTGILLPPDAAGAAHSNSDPITGQAAWYDLKVRIRPANRDETGTWPTFTASAMERAPRPSVLRYAAGTQKRVGRKLMDVLFSRR